MNTRRTLLPYALNLTLLFTTGLAHAARPPRYQLDRRVTCEIALSSPEFGEAVAALDDYDSTPDQIRDAAVKLRDFAQKHAGSRGLVDVLQKNRLEFANRSDQIFTYEERLQLMIDYLLQPANVELLAENVHFVWSGVEALIAANDHRMTKTEIATADAMIDALVRVSATHPSVVAQAWERFVWNDQGEAPTDLKWRHKNLITLIKESTRELKTLNATHREAKASAAQRADWLAKLDDELTANVRSDSIEDIAKSSLRNDEALRKSNAVYAREVAALTEHGQDVGDGFYGAFFVVVRYRMTRLIQRALGRAGHMASLDTFHDVLSTWRQARARSRTTEKRYLDPAYELRPDQEALVHAIDANPLFKSTLFGASTLRDLHDAQAWITVTPPEVPKGAVAALRKSSREYAIFTKNLRASLGLAPADLTDDLYSHYADEIFDAVPGPATDPDRTTLRFLKRCPADLNVGGKTGDCTSVGGVNFGNSLTWHYNTGYQILTMRRGKNLLGKVHLALFTIGGRPSIMIDAVEVSPQSVEGGPHHLDAQHAFVDAMDFVDELANRLRRDVVAMTTSNTRWVVESLRERAVDSAKDLIATYTFDEVAARHAIELDPAIPIRPYYQTIEGNFAAADRPFAAGQANDAKAEVLEAQVIGPAQREDGQIAEWLVAAVAEKDPAARKALFTQTAERILTVDANRQSIGRIYGLPASMPVSPAFLVIRLNQLYPAGDAQPTQTSDGFKLPKEALVLHRR